MTAALAALAAPAAGLWDVGRAAYHADRTRDSHSTLEVFRESVPLYHARYVTGELPGPEPTPAMRLGTALHVALLEPASWDDQVAVAPEVDRRTAAGKRAWEDFLLSALDRVVVTAEDAELVRGMAAAVRRNGWAASALDQAGRCEQAVVWEDAASGLPLRARLDKVLGNGLVMDVKSIDDPSPAAWARAVANFGYHRQAALYLDGAWAACRADGPFVFLAAGKRRPHECVAYTLDDGSLELGRRQNAATLRDLARRKASGDWRGRWQDGVQVTSLPRWALNQE